MISGKTIILLFRRQRKRKPLNKKTRRTSMKISSNQREANLNNHEERKIRIRVCFFKMTLKILATFCNIQTFSYFRSMTVQYVCFLRTHDLFITRIWLERTFFGSVTFFQSRLLCSNLGCTSVIIKDKKLFHLFYQHV